MDKIFRANIIPRITLAIAKVIPMATFFYKVSRTFNFISSNYYIYPFEEEKFHTSLLSTYQYPLFGKTHVQLCFKMKIVRVSLKLRCLCSIPLTPVVEGLWEKLGEYGCPSKKLSYLRFEKLRESVGAQDKIWDGQQNFVICST